MPTFSSVSKLEEKGTLPSLFYKASTTLIPNQTKDTKRKKKKKTHPISLIRHRLKILNKYIRFHHTMIKCDLFRDAQMIQHLQSTSVIHISKLKNKNYDHLFIEREKAFAKINIHL